MGKITKFVRKHDIAAYGYVRDKFGNFSSGINLVERTAGEAGIEITEIYTEKSDGEYENMETAKNMVNSLKNCVLFVPDTSDLYFDEFAMVKFAEKLNENHVILVDCYHPEFDNEAISTDNECENISGWMFSKTILMLERYMRASAEAENNSRESNIKKIMRKIEEAEKHIR